MEPRHIVLEGSHDLRDLGGYETRDGRRIRMVCVFRSDELHALTDADREKVAQLGIRVLEARRPVLAMALQHVEERWGGFEGYAVEHLAVDRDLPDRLRAALLVP